MAITLGNLLKLAQFTVQDPRRGARVVLAEQLPPAVRWMALVFTAVASALLTHLAIGLAAPQEPALFPGPLAMALLQGGVMVLTALAAQRIGAWRGGHGRLEDAVVLMAWLQFILLCLQAVQLVLMLVLPPLAEMVGLAGLVLFLWLLTAFVAEMHGFASLGRVFAGVLASMFAIALAMSVVLALVLSPQV